MKTWIVIANNEHVALGNGPLTAIVSSVFADYLDEAGDFNFVVLKSDPKIHLVDYELVAIRHVVKHGITWIHSGIIKEIKSGSLNGVATLEVSGKASLIGLSYELVALELYDLVPVKPYVIYRNKFSEYWIKWSMFDDDSSTGEHVRVQKSDEKLYFAHEYPFKEIIVSILNGNENATTCEYQYSKQGGWETLPNLTDTTEEKGKPFNKSGSIAFNPPSGWKKVSLDGTLPYNCHVVRFDPDWEHVDFTINEVTIMAKGPTNRNLLPLLENSGWELIGHQNTGKPLRLGIWHKSRLEALTIMRKHSGQHFYQLNGGRKIVWLRDEDIGQNSGITAIKAPQERAIHQGGEDVCFVFHIEEIINTNQITTDIRAFGGGTGDERATLRHATWSASEKNQGYRLDVNRGTIVSELARERFGRCIERPKQFGHIMPLTDLLGNEEKPDPNQLLEAALSWLKDHDKAHVVYNLYVVALQKRLYPGQKLRIQYHDPSQNIHIDSLLFILGITSNVKQDGTLVHEIAVSSIARWPPQPGQFIARSIQELRELQGHGQGLALDEPPIQLRLLEMRASQTLRETKAIMAILKSKEPTNLTTLTTQLNALKNDNRIGLEEWTDLITQLNAFKQSAVKLKNNPREG